VFQGIINNAKSAAGALMAKYAARVSVAVPFVIALGFATMAGTLMLIERFGHRDAYLIVAGGFTVIGLLAALAVRTKEQHEVIAERQAVGSETAGVASEAEAAAAVQIPLALLGTLFSSPIGPSTLLSLVRLTGRNLPLALLLGVIGVLLWPNSGDAPLAEDEEITPQSKPFPLNGASGEVHTR
jgi:hypothetical protein